MRCGRGLSLLGGPARADIGDEIDAGVVASWRGGEVGVAWQIRVGSRGPKKLGRFVIVAPWLVASPNKTGFAFTPL
jgi:hypothetical protein